MPDLQPQQYRTKEGDQLDHICWKHYGDQPRAMEQVLEANPGLSDQGAVLPSGLLIQLPDLAVFEDSSTISLWD